MDTTKGTARKIPTRALNNTAHINFVTRTHLFDSGRVPIFKNLRFSFCL